MSEQTHKSPDQELAAAITKAFVEAQLLDAGKAAKQEDRIASGVMREGDWRLLFETQRPLKNAGADGG
ncbi:MAG: hypothetical protein Q8N47_02910 [Bryobacterales bacterium]|nr:hypothetical protein [Bryobacterales bacterium]